MSDPYLTCGYCGDPCACRATRDELERYKEALRLIGAAAGTLMHDEDGGRELEAFLIFVAEKASAVLQDDKPLEKSDGDFHPENPFKSH
jgi:hypothetical protein